MKTALIFGIIVLLGFLAVYMITNPRTEERLAETIFTPTPTSNMPIQDAEETPTTSIPTATPITRQVEADKALIKTEKGDITIEFYKDDAPNTVTNFINKANSEYYNGLTFWRVENWVIQGGDPNGDGTGGQDSLPTELNQKPFVAGAVGMARRPVDVNISNDSQFFITKVDAHSLDGQYTNFGIVTEGMDVLENIEPGDQILSIELN